MSEPTAEQNGHNWTFTHMRDEVTSLLRSPFAAIWFATAALFILCVPVSSSSVSHSALVSMLPFASILAIAAIGEMLVIQQGGLDLSVAGGISLSAALMSTLGGSLFTSLLIILAVAAAVGLINGLAVTRFGITPFVATLGVNALLIGTVLQVTGGSASSDVPTDLTSFLGGKFVGIPVPALVAIVFAAILSAVLKATMWGRRFQLSGASSRAAWVAGIRIKRYEVGTFIAASICYALAGVMLAGYSTTPSLNAGNTYLLPSVAAVVLGGTLLTGGRASVWATVVGALFLTQLERLVITTGADQAIQFLIQGAIVALGMGLRSVAWSTVFEKFRAPRAPRAEPVEL